MLYKFIISILIALCVAGFFITLIGLHVPFLFLVSEGHFILAGIYYIIMSYGLLTLFGIKTESGQK